MVLKIGDECKVIIEAKRGKEDLLNKNNAMEIMYYAAGINVPIAILTNGRSWQFYFPLLGGGIEKKRFFTMDISDTDSSNIASKLIELLSKDNVRKIDESNFEELYEKYRKHIKATIKDIKQTKTTKSEKSYLQDYLSVYDDVIGTSIYSFYFNGVIYQTEKWIDLLTGILDIMYSTHIKDFDKVLGVTGRQGRIYFSYNKNEVNNPKEIKDTGIYVDTKLSSKNIVKLCSYIIYEFGYSEEDLKIKTSNRNTIESDTIETKKTVERQLTKKKTVPIKDTLSGMKKKISSVELRCMIKDLPSSLGHTLEVYYHVLGGLSRTDATNLVAKRKDITSSTIVSTQDS